MYESVEIRLLELLLNMRVPKNKKSKLVQFGREIFKNKRKNWYSRAVAALIVAKYGENSDIRKLAKHYYSNYEEEAKLRKYLVVISTLLEASDEGYIKVIKKARVEYPQDIQSLIGLIDIIKTDPDNIPETMHKKLTLDEIHLPDIKIQYMNIRKFILLNLLVMNPTYHPKLKSKIKKLIRNNSDPIMDEKLRYLCHRIS